MSVLAEAVSFVPLALGFFGLGVGYLIYGPQELLGFPARGKRVDVTTGIRGVAMPGFLPFVTRAIGMARVFDSDPRANALMSIPFLVLSTLGAVVSFGAGDDPAGALFAGLTLVYVCDLFASLGSVSWERLLGLAHVATGLWLMSLTAAAVLDVARGFVLPP
jgi:hypothetical protein